MEPAPSELFEKNYAEGKAQVVWVRHAAESDTPISAYLKLAAGAPNSFLLESVIGGNMKERYSFIGFAPDLIWTCTRGKAAINRRMGEKNSVYEKISGKALESLRALVKESHIDLPEGFPPLPLSAGLFGYLSYDMIREIEHIKDEKQDSLNLPDSILMRPSVMAAFDSVDNSITFITPVYSKKDVDVKTARATAEKRLENAAAAMKKPVPPQKKAGARVHVEPKSNTPHEKYLAMVKRAIEYIKAGDIFQVVLSQRFSLPFTQAPFSLYESLRRLNPSPFLFFLDFGGFQLVGSSPEILVRLRGGKVSIRPIAGTRPRGESDARDAALAESLLADPKERAEHLMLLDLGRNDAGRVAKPGSVKVTESFTIERYSHVMHIVSNVESALDKKFDACDALFAGFPAGTVSGAPKIRAMEIIEELEAERRGPYAGCVGYIGANNTLDTCITLRTAILKDGMMVVQSGSGIVADSDPEYEYNECVAKARALIRAAEEANKQS